MTRTNVAAAPGERGDVSRRNLLLGGGTVGLAALAGAGRMGDRWARHEDRRSAEAAERAGATPGRDVHSFLSRPDLRPPILAVDVVSTPADVPPYVFLANKPYIGRSVGQRGLLIAERGGGVAWVRAPTQGLDLHLESLKAKQWSTCCTAG